jgi:4-hydroxybenzoate polyprenyltransferase
MLLLLGLRLATVSGAAWEVALYAVASTAYTFWFKQLLLVDLFSLARLYTIRLFAGGEATGHPVSMCLLAFASFFFSFAIIKRVSESASVQARGETTIIRRCYVVSDLQIRQMMGVSTSFISYHLARIAVHQ